jgi:hypothetical protein
MNPPGANEILGAMITPALLITAAGTLVLSTSTRLGRVVDRVRTLADLAENLQPADGQSTEEATDKRQLIFDQLAKLTLRINYLVPAITTLYTAIFLLVGSSITAGVMAIVRAGYAWVPVVPGMLGAGMLFYASTLLIREARRAADSTLNEMAYVRRVIARKTASPKGPL